MSRKATATIPSSRVRRCTSPKTNSPVGSMASGKRWTSTPKRPWAALVTMVVTPRVAIMGIR